MAKISVIVAVYNVEDYVGECLDSILNQTENDLEVLCVIDGSEDRSEDIVRQHAALDNRIRVLAKENGGLSSARNFGMQYATGDIVMFVDADDSIVPGCCELVGAAMDATGAEVLVFGAHLVPESAATPWFNRAFSPELVSLPACTPSFMFADYASPFVWRNALRQSVLERESLAFDETLPFGEDLVFQFALYPRAKGVAAIPDKLYHYRVNRTGSLMDRWSDEASHLHAHVDMLDAILTDWRELGWLDCCCDEFFGRAQNLLLFGVEHLRADERCAHFERVHALWDSHAGDVGWLARLRYRRAEKRFWEAAEVLRVASIG